jgi:hypothetical protein
MNELPVDRLPAPSRGLLETDGAIFLLIVGIIAALFLGYLVFDWVQGKRAARRLNELRQRGRPTPTPAPADAR